MKPSQVKDFWIIYRSKAFKKELEKHFSKIQEYANFETLHERFSYSNSGLILNRSSVFVCKALKIYDQYTQSLLPVILDHTTEIARLITRIPRFENLYKILRNSELKVGDLLELERFWNLPLKGLGPKNFAYLYYCLERHNLRIERCRWILA